ncbi:hypothetical protein EYF80_000358 [Liparis tanakae]|uniref:Uncharacterized protein n=1 Tax=Liparis tanakae TaxID=230148 RepID=A0A4Z2JFX0_9TELE|nr:hypothetical protein EYF80_000358 [Liparis tanakae]
MLPLAAAQSMHTGARGSVDLARGLAWTKSCWVTAFVLAGRSDSQDLSGEEKIGRERRRKNEKGSEV